MVLDKISRSSFEIGDVYEAGRLAILVERSICFRWLGVESAGVVLVAFGIYQARRCSK